MHEGHRAQMEAFARQQIGTEYRQQTRWLPWVADEGAETPQGAVRHLSLSEATGTSAGLFVSFSNIKHCLGMRPDWSWRCENIC